MEFEIIALYSLAALLALEGLSALLRRKPDPAKVRSRLRVLSKSIAEQKTEDVGTILRDGSGLRLPSLAGLEIMLYRAGGSLSVGRFWVLSLVLASCGFLAVFFLTNVALRSLPALLLGIIPFLFLRRTATKRMRRFADELPDALELITRCMRTGHALGAGFQMVGEEFADPIGTEFGLLAEELRMGQELREALENLSHRVDNDDLPYFTTAVLIQRQTGGNLAELLDKLGTLLRERCLFHGRVRALTAQGRGAATFLALWLPFIIVVIFVVSPEYLMPLIENTWGHALLATVFGIDVFAYYISLRIADVQN